MLVGKKTSFVVVVPFFTTAALSSPQQAFLSSSLRRSAPHQRLFGGGGRRTIITNRHQLNSTAVASFSFQGMQSSETTTAQRTVGVRLATNPKVQHAPEALLPDWMLAERTKCLTNTTNNSATTTTSKNSKRVRRGGAPAVYYWMQRDMRTEDNWALLWAASIAQLRQVPLRVLHVLNPPPAPAQAAVASNNSNAPLRPPPSLVDLPITARYAHFWLGGLQHVHAELAEHGIPLDVLQPSCHELVGQAVCDHLLQHQKAVMTPASPVANSNKAAAAETAETEASSNDDDDDVDLDVIVICDFSPLRHARQWMELQAAPILQRHDIPMYQVDAHNIVPVWIAGEGRRQVGARTLRPRINRVLDKYLDGNEFPTLSSVYQQPHSTSPALPPFDRSRCEEFLQLDKSVPVAEWAVPGTQAGMKQFDAFVKQGLKTYHDERNDPNRQHVCSDMSPWINFGHVSFQRLALKTKNLDDKRLAAGAASFIEEGVVRRELSDNYLYHTPNDYDSLQGAADWAQETLRVHSADRREWSYTLAELEQGQTHDDLWNAAQLQVVREGRMHGFLRMYWAKKILEWTDNPLPQDPQPPQQQEQSPAERALNIAQYLNDKYALDGRDPNGFVGVGWSIMGIHDQGWKEREIFGKIRFMNYKGCQRKLNIPQFVARYKGAAQNAAKALGQQTLHNATTSTTTTASRGAKSRMRITTTTTTTTTSSIKRSRTSTTTHSKKRPRGRGAND